jgi:hypothetical protein
MWQYFADRMSLSEVCPSRAKLGGICKASNVIARDDMTKQSIDVIEIASIFDLVMTNCKSTFWNVEKYIVKNNA